jgi:hypothetical protein
MKGKRDQNLGREQGDKWAATDLNMVGNGREVFLIKWKIQSKNMRLYNWLHTLLGG